LVIGFDDGFDGIGRSSVPASYWTGRFDEDYLFDLEAKSS
jgi:hypothetical protein